MENEKFEIWYNERDFYQCYIVPNDASLPVGNTLLKCINGKTSFVNIFEIEQLSCKDNEAIKLLKEILKTENIPEINKTQSQLLLDHLTDENNDHPLKGLL
ncbi:MAG: hypothetical protein PHW82_07415 [Bacteroidales bacterium]|nr:hypothetical protein [Bacteroidales bacterium]